MTPHSSDDDDRYRTDEEKSVANAQDPLPRFRSQLESDGLLEPGESDAWEVELRAMAIEEQDWADSRPVPEPARARRWLYTEGS